MSLSTSARSSTPSTGMLAASTRLRWTSETGPFGRRQRRPRGPRLPVIAVTGFLGSGKTTLIRALLEKPEGANTAVIVNEYGEIGIDNALLRSSSDVTVLLGNGCLCCNIRTDLQETLRELFADRGRGREFYLQALVSVVDAVSGEDNLARMPEARKQVALADRIVVSMSDLADRAATVRLLERIASLSAA